jgi:hypothetical protein
VRVSTVKGDRPFQAWRSAIRERLLASRGLEPEMADLWCTAWEAEAKRQGRARDGDYWDAGTLWIDAQCAARKRPPN